MPYRIDPDLSVGIAIAVGIPIALLLAVLG